MRVLGTVGYAEAQELQSRLVEARRRDETPDTLLLLEHPPVITLGSGSDPSHVLFDADARARRGIELYETGRGGDVTYHGPGQLVGYPVLRLPDDRHDLHRYLRDLEEVLIRALRRFGIEGRREAGLTGVWTDGGKIAALGIRVSSGWVTSHGFALNVDADVSGFDAIVPCGIPDRAVTSVAREAHGEPSMESVRDAVESAFREVFDFDPVR